MDMTQLANLDTALFIYINHTRNALFDVIMPALSDLRLLLPLLVPFLAWRFYRGTRNERIMWIIGITAVALSDLLCARIFKPLVGRARPYEILDSVYLFKKARWLVTDPAFRSHISETLAWPSCHASNIWTAAAFLTAWKRWHGAPIILLACLVSWSRIYLGVHYPLDIVGGAFIGAIIGLSLWKFGEFLISENSADY